jgi:HEAT repeat protein
MKITPEKIFKKIEQLGKTEAANLLFKLYHISDNPTNRLNVLKKLNELEDQEHFIEIESTLMSDEDFSCRLEAVNILVKFYRENAIEPLKWALDNDKSWKVRLFIIEKLLLLDKNNTSKFLQKGLNDPSKEVRNKTGIIISNLAKENTELISLLIQNLKDKRIYVRWAAEEALLLINELPINLLINELKDDLYTSKRTIIRLLGKLKVAEVIPALIEIYEKESDPFIKGEILTAFGKIQDERGLNIIDKALKAEENYHLKYIAAQIIKSHSYKMD